MVCICVTSFVRYAETLNKTNFYIVGEVAASPPMIGERLGVMETNTRFFLFARASFNLRVFFFS